ncbi:hypothetical protein DPMN_055732 [Dreissena polymorpha]|uniref:Uncharacterized protein n=1 Tax=Dreissena polymorpha TaxID=45954 RepID=A0A9D4CQH1_DREPO|nr:hypothetical protein DPMN_055732 [Dreissena polymorpha]
MPVSSPTPLGPSMTLTFRASYSSPIREHFRGPNSKRAGCSCGQTSCPLLPRDSKGFYG